jgi:serine/threonine protein kinase
MSDLRIGKFQILGTLGTGAHSTIFHIRRSADSKNYALKVVPIGSPEHIKYLHQAEHEFQVAQMLDHANLIKIYALEKDRDLLFRTRKARLLIEYVNGRTLDTFKRIPIPLLVTIFARVASGLAHMHRRHVCHADLKPGNILLSRTGDVKIIDYGLAWIKGQDKQRLQGTPEYMAPEQAKQKMVNEKTDIFNLGATMYRLVTWRHPPLTLVDAGGVRLDSKTWEAKLQPVEECTPEAPALLCDLIHRCLAFFPSQRPQRMHDVKEELEHLAESLAPTTDQSFEGLAE